MPQQSDGYTKTWSSDKMAPLSLCQKIIERMPDGKGQVMVKDTTTGKLGIKVEDEWEYLNYTDEKVAIVYNMHRIGVDMDVDRPLYHKRYEYNFDPETINDILKGRNSG